MASTICSAPVILHWPTLVNYRLPYAELVSESDCGGILVPVDHKLVPSDIAFATTVSAAKPPKYCRSSDNH